MSNEKDKTQMSKNETSSAVVKQDSAPVAAYSGLANVELMKEALSANVGDGGLSPFDLDRVKIPSGGGTTWDIPSIDGEKNEKEIVGIIVHWHQARSYWQQGLEETGGGSPPDCASPDGKIGHGIPGGECASCKYNAFGTSAKGKGKACKEVKALYILQGDSALPISLPLPPSSLQPAKKYLLALAAKGLAYRHVVTGISLEKVKNSGGILYAQAKFRMVRPLSAAERAEADAYSRGFGGVVSAAALSQVGALVEDAVGGE